MTEPKRLPFTTINSSEKDKKPKKDPPTVRFTLSLNRSNDQQCLEFSYADLLKKSLGEKEKKTVENGDDPFGDEDHEALAAIAKKYEEKYNPKNTKWKKKHGRIQDLVDLGEGYDETDDFIDNSEAYDEVIPACLTTKLGGFYINSGKLDFKEISDDSDDDFKLGTLKKVKKKPRIESDSESDGEKKEINIKKRKLKDGLEGGEKKKKKILNGTGEKVKKVKKQNPDKAKKKLSPTVAELLKQQTESTAGVASHVNGRTTPDGFSQSSNDMNESSQEDAINSAIDSVMSMSKLDAVFDSVIGMNDSDSKDNGEEKKEESIPKLPEGLKPEFLQVIDKLKETARVSSVGKGKFFNNDVSEMLLEIELTTRQLPCSQRSSIFGHLACFLPCTKDTLLKRAKKLRVERQDDQLKGPLQKLKDAINAVMPALQQKHETECQIWKQNREESNSKDGSKAEGKDRDTEESEEEGEKANQEPGKKKVAAPKKKFEWNENLRSLLCDVVRVKMKIYDYMKTRTQTPEEYLKTFLDREIKALWPKGWMQTSVLMKESRPGHVAWTNPPKIKKVPVINKTSNSTTTTPVMATKQTTPSSASLTVTKQGVTPVSATQGSFNPKTVIIPGNTPVRAPGSGDASRLIPTLLDYANEQSSLSSKLPTEKTGTGSKVREQTNSGSSVSSATAAGLSLLASSAASQKYMGDRSWDHVVSDILRSSLSSPSEAVVKSTSNMQMPKQQESKNDFMAQFEKYASNMFHQQLDKEGSKMSPPKSQQLPSPTSALQINPQDAHTMVQKLKAAQMSKQSPPPAHQKSTTNSQLASYLNAQNTSSGSTSMLNQEAFKQFLESQGKLTPNQGGGDMKAKNVTPQRVKPKTIVVYSTSSSGNSLHGNPTVTKYTSPNISNNNTDNSKKPVLVRSISQGSVTAQTGSQIQGQKISPTSTHISSQRVSPMASPSTGQRQSPSNSSSHFHNPHSVSNLTSPSKGEAAATNLLQSLFGQIDPAHSRMPQSPSSSVSRTTPPQNKNSASPIWSMTSIVQTQPGNTQQTSSTSPSSYALPGMPKPVPGYQSIKLSNFNKESGGIPQPLSPTMKSLLHNPTPQGIPSHLGSYTVPTSPLLTGQPTNSVPNQTGFFPPYTTQQTTYPYGTYYTGKSSNSSHGY